GGGFFLSSRRRHTRFSRDWSSDVCSSDLFLETVFYPATVTTADVITHFEDDYGPDAIKKALNELYKDGFIQKPSHGQYCGRKPAEISSEAAEAGESVKVRSFYEKDDE